MTIIRVRDPALIKFIVTHDSIWPYVSEDGITKEEWEPMMHDSIYQMAIADDDGLGGVFILTPESSKCWQVHTCILPTHRGEKAIKAATECRDWMFNNTPCLTIITKVPVFNKAAKKLALNAGFKSIGMIESAWAKSGEIFDVELMGVTKCQ